MELSNKAKVSVSKPSAALWCLVLFSETVLVPESEIGKSPDIVELMDKGLVKVSDGTLSKQLSLVDSSMELSLEEKNVLLIFRMGKDKPYNISSLIIQARNIGVQSPLRAIKRLMELNLIEFGEDKKFLLSRFATC